jgi:hypothetical protein
LERRLDKVAYCTALAWLLPKNGQIISKFIFKKITLQAANCRMLHFLNASVPLYVIETFVFELAIERAKQSATPKSDAFVNP